MTPPVPDDVQQELTVISEALEVLHDQLAYGDSDDAYSAQQRRWALQNIEAAARSAREAVAWLNNY